MYNYIFITIGPGGLSNDLLLYLPGLSSTLSFASLTVRSPFLVLFETHILPLDSATLRPAFKAIILALLPGLEDETSEDFEQTYKLVDGLRDAVRPEGAKDEYFWQCFFLASITGSNRRLGALAYLNRELPKLGYRKENFPSSINDVPEEAALESAKVLTSPEGGLLIRCFAAGLKDDQLLIQRGFLELLVTHLPLHSKVFHNFVMVKERDLDLLMAAAIGVVSRRDMSLNRRLWSWLLGPDPAVIESDKGASLAAAATRTRYFEEYGLQSLLRALTEMIKQYPIKPAERYKPYRIALSLMDRWEIGGLVVPQIFMPIIISVKTYQTEAVSKADFNEVLKSASFFFDGVESGIIWGAINTLIGEAMIWPTPKLQDALAKLEVVRFILAHFNVKEEEMVLVHAPCNALSLLALGEKATLTSPFPKPIIQKALLLVSDLIDIIPERAYVSRPPTARSSTEEGKTAYHPTIDNNVLVEKIKLFYSQEGGNLDAVLPPFKNTEVSRLLMRQVSRLTEHAIGTSSLPEPKVGITRIADILRALTSSMPVVATVNVEAIFIAIKAKLLAGRVNFTEFSAIAVILTALFPRYISSVAFTDLVPDIVEAAWSFLSPSSPKYHVETVQALWDLQSALGVESRDIESCLCSLITQNDTEGTFTTRDAESGRRFAVLWNHTLHDHGSSKDRKGSAVGLNSSDTTDIADYKIMLRRPLFLCLDALADERTQMFAWARAWLQGLPTLDSVFHCFVAEFNQFPLFHKEEREGFSSQAVEGGEDIDACVYYLQGLLGLLRWAGIDTWACIAKSRIQLDHDTVKLEMPSKSAPRNWLSYMLTIDRLRG